MQLPEIKLPLLRNIFVKPVQSEQLHLRFPIGKVVHGRIAEVLPQSNVFILHVDGLNLMAKSHLSLFKGDKIIGKVQKNQSQVELKLVEVNGQEVNQNLRLYNEDAGYTQLHFLSEFFGEKSYLEIYPDGNSGTRDDKERRSTVKIIVNSTNENSIVAELHYTRPELSGAIWFENQGLLDFFRETRSDIEESLQDEEIHSTQISFLPLQREISLFRKEWLGSSRLDLRA